jgi:hypothetical protein
MSSERYKIIRHYFKRGKRVVKRGLTLDQAQRHCFSPESSSRTATSAAGRKRTRTHGAWFDGYTQEN